MSNTQENPSEKSKDPFNVAVFVVGDLNRSPRMLNHCIALTEAYDNINEVSLIGFNGGDIRNDIASNPKIKQYYIPMAINNLLRKLPRFLFFLSAFIKIIIQTLSIFYILFKVPKPKFLILQNPPGIPSILICWIFCRIRGTKFIIDWHNYGYTILQVNKRNKLIVKLAYYYEKFLSTKSDMNFCVSQAEKRDLKKQFSIEAICLPDKPVKGLFKFLNEEEAKKLYSKYNELKPLLTEKKEEKPITMISSTSWTPDEDFGMLLNCFIKTEEILKSDDKIDINKLKKVIILITGRGPMRDEFMDKVEKAKLEIFDVKSIWLDSDDYPKLLNLCDLGISLHYSSSGIDLPMKVVDMFSACLPAAAIYYDTIKELVLEDENGFLFKNENDLCKILKNVILEISNTGKCEKLIKYRDFLKKQLDDENWVAQWIKRVKPSIEKKGFI